MGKIRLRWQLFPTYLFIMLVSLGVIAVVTSRSIRQIHIREVKRSLEHQATLMARVLGDRIDWADGNGGNEFIESYLTDPRMRLTLIGADGTVIFDTDHNVSEMDNHATRAEVVEAFRDGVGSSVRHGDTLDRDMVYVAQVVRSDGGIAGVVRTSLSLDEVRMDLASFYRKLFIGGGLIALFGAFLSWRVGNRLSRPLEELERIALRFSRGELDVETREYRSQELTSLSRTLHQMARELRERIDRVEAQRNEHHAVLEGMVEGVLAIDQNDIILNVNRSAGNMLGIKPEQAVGKPLRDWVRNRDILRLLSRAKQASGPLEAEMVLYLPQERIVQGHTASLREEDGQDFGVIMVLHDVTRLRELEIVRKEFVANVSHELKTPITTIKGFVETLLDGAMDDPKQARQFMEIIDRHTNRLINILEDLLSLSKLEQEEGDLEWVVLNAAQLIQNSIKLCLDRAREKQIDVIPEVETEVRIRGEASLLEQALVNLIDNAIKYSPSGTQIRVRSSIQGDRAQIEVIDQGDGIPTQHLPRIFERFYRVDKARSNKTGGTGLGLSIVKHIARVHRGNVDVTSILGEGSTFRLILPHIDE